jgi:hypothetical protein
MAHQQTTTRRVRKLPEGGRGEERREIGEGSEMLNVIGNIS